MDGTVRPKQLDVMPVMFTCTTGRPNGDVISLPLFELRELKRLEGHAAGRTPLGGQTWLLG
jgi:hypothetical protein